jgi:hypothetical protein
MMDAERFQDRKHDGEERHQGEERGIDEAGGSSVEQSVTEFKSDRDRQPKDLNTHPLQQRTGSEICRPEVLFHKLCEARSRAHD